MVDGMIGPYRLLSRVASGAQATVYRVTDTRNGELRALKVLDPHLASDPSHRKRLEREARLAASLAHPNIVRVLDIGEENGTPYIAMEYLWRSLDSLIDDGPLMSEQRVVQVAADIAAGLEAAHRAGIIHRDIKPQNVLLTTDGVAQLTDFGIAHARDLTALTRTGARLGTPHYMSPEQVDGKSSDERSDIYSLGCVMYHMLTGSPPFKAESAMAVMRMHLDAVPAPLATRAGRVAPVLARIVERCMAKNPADRYVTASELGRELSRIGPGASRSSGGSSPAGFVSTGSVSVSSASDEPVMQRFEIGDDDDPPFEQLTAREISGAMLQPDIDLSTDKVCRNCGLGAESNRLFCLRCGFAEWRAYGESVLAPRFTMTGAEHLGRKDPVPEQALFARAALLILLATALSLAFAAFLIWSDRGVDETVSAGFATLTVPVASLDVPIVKRFTSAPFGGQITIQFDQAEANAIGISVVSFRVRFGGIDSALVIDPSPDTLSDPPPEPAYRRFSVDVFSQPDVGEERFFFRFGIPEEWLSERGISLENVRLWTDAGDWTPLETQHVSSANGLATFQATAPRAGLFSIGALP
ncbi:MAG: protein kinase [Chloroflexi bacterium]|nr:protein kinase [Chloroflexota bacterium]